MTRFIDRIFYFKELFLIYWLWDSPNVFKALAGAIKASALYWGHKKTKQVSSEGPRLNTKKAKNTNNTKKANGEAKWKVRIAPT